MNPGIAARQFFGAGDAEGTFTGEQKRTLCRRMFWTALIVRLLYLTLAHTYRFRTTEDHFPYGWEMGRIARSLALGEGFSSPFGGHTGPTAWTPPLYPLLMAACFRLFGIYSNLSAWFLLATNSVFSSATAPLIYRIADRCYGRRNDGLGVALWSGWLWALYPAALQYAVHWPWDMALTAFFFTWALLLGLSLRGTGSAPGVRQAATWAWFGVAWGLIALLNSSLLTFLPVQLAWVVFPWRRQIAGLFLPACAGAICFALLLAPWIARNKRAFHAFVPLRGNLGAEMYMSVLPSHMAFPWGTDIPVGGHSPELARYKAMGELAYSKAQGAKAKQIIAANPSRFLRDILLRVQFFWAGVPHPYDHGVADEALRELNYSFLSLAGLLGLGLSLRRRVPAAGLFAGAFAVVPVIYYLVTVQARFRHPLEPLITIFAVYLFRNADRSRLFSPRRAGTPAMEVAS